MKPVGKSDLLSYLPLLTRCMCLTHLISQQNPYEEVVMSLTRGLLCEYKQTLSKNYLLLWVLDLFWPAFGLFGILQGAVVCVS